MVTAYYDSMLAKVIAHGPGRATALDRLAGALRAFEIAGVTTNVPFLSRLVAHPGFRAGDVDTGLIERAFDTLTARGPAPEPVLAAAAMYAAGVLDVSAGGTSTADAFGATPAGGALDPPAGAMHLADAFDGSAGAVHAGSALDWPGADPWTAFKGWRLWGEASQPVRFGIDGEIVEKTVTFLEGGGIRAELAGASLAGTSLAARVVRRDGARVVLDLSERIVVLRIVVAGGGTIVAGGGADAATNPWRPRRERYRRAVRAP